MNMKFICTKAQSFCMFIYSPQEVLLLCRPLSIPVLIWESLHAYIETREHSLFYSCDPINEHAYDS